MGHLLVVRLSKVNSQILLLSCSLLFFYTFVNAQQADSTICQLVETGIQQGDFPGCVVFAAHKGVPVYHRAFGYYTYDSLRPVSQQTIYDLASITKVAAGTLALMKLYEDGVIELDAPLKVYLKHTKNKKNLTLRQLLAHQSGMKNWLNFFQILLKRRILRPITVPGDTLTRTVMGQGHYLVRPTYRTIRREIMRSELADPGYAYSGLFFYLIPELIQRLTGQTMEVYLSTHFYQPMGLKTLGFVPKRFFKTDRIAPTEYDSLFRKVLVHGEVHDEGAALMGGWSANAGLFSTAEDIGALFQMLLNGGEWKGVRYLLPTTIDLFSSIQYPVAGNRRALGFDKVPLDPEDRSNAAPSASRFSYGHTGFTGTIVWADHQNELLYVFLSNRVYPSRERQGLINKSMRQQIQEAIYQEFVN